MYHTIQNSRLTIEEENDLNDDEDKVRQIKPERIVKTNGTECPNQRVNNDICYCDRAPGPSRNVATKPHVKTSYCVETESNKAVAAAAAAADAVANKSNGKITRDSPSGNKLSPVAKDFGGGKRTSTSQVASRNADISTILSESFTRSHGAEDSLKKSIFSYTSAKPSTVIIEELPNDEVCENPRVVNFGKTRAKIKKEADRKQEKNKKLSSPGKKSAPTTTISPMPNQIETLNEHEKLNSKKERSLAKETAALTEQSDKGKTNNVSSLEKESKTKTSNKIHSRREFHKESYDKKLETELEVLSIEILIINGI